MKKLISPLLLLTFTMMFAVASAGRAEEATETVMPFNGKDFSGWLTKGGSPEDTLRIGAAKLDPANPAAILVEVGGRELVNFRGRARDFYTQAKFGDALIEIEFMVPKGSNSGVYVMGEYEMQIFDSYGKEIAGPGDVGGIYGAQAPRLNAAKAPGEWQRFVIDFRAPKFDANGKKTANARFLKVTLNGEVIHEDVEMKGPTPGGLTGQEHAAGPLMFQGDHGPVAYRNIKISLKK